MHDQRPAVGKTIHFVGSVCLPNTSTVFQGLCDAVGPYLRRVPDGETGRRADFILWQKEVFQDYPEILRSSIVAPPKEQSYEIDVKSMQLRPLEYDKYAIASYREFCDLRERGVVPAGVRFQVCLPTPINILCNLIEQAYRPKVEPIYEASMLGVIATIQDAIPHHDLAIQFDCPSEFAFLEGVATVPVDWFAPVKEGLIERVVRMASAVHPDVELGFHMCYGDFGHRHFKEPADTALMVDFANALKASIKRPINWIHMPVPKARTDNAYFLPLKRLDLGETELYLGLLHMNDEEGARRRIEAAKVYVRDFGIATECGLGRATVNEVDSVLDIAQRLIAME